MAEHNQLIDAINIRTAVRAYDDEPIDDDAARQLDMTLQPVNLLGNVNLQLVLNQPKVFEEASASGHLTGASDYIAIVAPKDDEQAKERAGFYAERAVLTATLRGLGTLWVAGSWDRAEAAKHCRIAEDEALLLAVVIGYPKNRLAYQSMTYDELCDRQRTHRASKTYEQFTATMDDATRAQAPDWFKAGVEAAMKAPSAMNRQPITFSYNPDDDTAAAHIDASAGDEHYALNDLGIAKLHFQIGAGQGQWAWGDGGLFIHK